MNSHQYHTNAHLRRAIILPGNHSAYVSCAVILQFVFAAAAIAQAPSEADDEFERIADRYWQVLEERPRKGTAFDLWYRHYQQADRLDELQQRVDEAVEAGNDRAEPHLLAGLLHEKERRFADALSAYEAAAKLAPDDYYPQLCRGMLLFTQRQYREAAETLEAAVALEPPRSDLVEIVQALVRCHLRIGDREAARATWSQFSTIIQGDPYTLRRLAEVVTAEGDFDGAIDVWRQLVDQPLIEPVARLTARIEIAQLHADRGEAENAVTQFREVLKRLKADGWLARDVCRRIERTFLQAEDTTGLVEFWQEQRVARPQDLEVLQQLARAMRTAGRVDEAMGVYREAIALAPTRADMRR